MKISFITTVYNEEKTIEAFVQSLFNQTQKPDEIIITDGNSKDKTKEILKKFDKRIILLEKKGNRSVGRNKAIKHATGDIIVCSDAGNILDKNWIKYIIEPFKDRSVDVVSGYYKGIAKTVFQKSVIPYALVMPDKVNPHTFLPATRSIAFRKHIWEEIGGFNEKLSHNEDYAFAKALQKVGAKIQFKKDAIVYWIPRTTLKAAYVMMYRFAYGDAQARIFRPKVMFLFLRYFVGITLLVIAYTAHSVFLGIVLFVFVLLYIFWSIRKNYQYVNKWQAFIFLPLLQFSSDAAVLLGTTQALLGLKMQSDLH